MSPIQLAAIASEMSTADYAIRVGKLRDALDAAGRSGLSEDRAAEILELPLPVFRIVAAHVKASQTERTAHYLADAITLAGQNQAKGIMLT